MLQQLSQWYLATLSEGGYALIALLMALESTLVPIPSEMIIPPAAYLAHTQGNLSLPGVILAGTAGSWVGASIMYWLARALGRPFLMRYGRYVGLGREKLERAEVWAARYGWSGVFFSRFLPVIRHLIGVPGGIVRMDFRWYSLATLLGSGIWCSVLAGLGATLGRNPQLLNGSLHRFVGLVVLIGLVLAALYYLFVYRPTRKLDRSGKF
jgi:membrane protein DedA with SNARE-associated domain